MPPKIILFPLLLSCLLLTGCYGKSELDDLAYVVAMGADVSPSGDESNVQITYQVALPIKITGENGETGKATYTTYTTTAPSLTIASSKINAIASKNIDLSHVSLILYSQELAKQGIEGHVNSLISNVAIRPRTIVAVCEGSAKDFLETVTPVLETSPARYYELLISSFHYTSRSVGTEVLPFYTKSQSAIESPIAVKTMLDENQEAKFSGITVFKGLQMIGEIPEEHVIGYLLLANKLNEASINLPSFQNQEQTITLSMKECKKPKIKVTLVDSVPIIDITVFLVGHLDSNGDTTCFYQKELMEMLHQRMDDYIQDIIQLYLNDTLRLKADVSGLGRYAKKNFWTWDDFEKIKWKEKYPYSKFHIHVESTVNVSQIISHFLPTID